MRRWVGRWLMGVGALHSVVGLVVFAGPLRALLTEGVVNALGSRDPLRNLAFWFLFGGVMTVLVGYLADWIERAPRGVLPPALGWSLLSVAVLGVTLAPASGFWLVLPAAIGILARSRSRARHTATS